MGLELEIVHAFKTYNGNPILRDCSFAFATGRTYVLQGPNGSGKSTLFRILALLENPDRGRVEYRDGGRILAADLALRRRITLVLPRTGIFNTTVFEQFSDFVGCISFCDTAHIQYHIRLLQIKRR